MYKNLIWALLCLNLVFSAPLNKNDNNLPIGTIITWNPLQNLEIPQGWELCNGQTVTDFESPLFGQTLPPLNTEHFFLKGAQKDQVGKIRQDSMPQHGHISKGHTHQDEGHTHEDAGHTHSINLPKFPFPVLIYGHQKGDGDGGPRWAIQGHWPPYKTEMDLSKAKVEQGQAQLKYGHAKVSKMTSGSAGSETRPKNVKFPYIIKVKEVEPTQITDIVVASRSKKQTKMVNPLDYLNQGNFFIRGGTLEEKGQEEMFSLQDHTHEDQGHTHKDLGHGHEDLGHVHELELRDKDNEKVTYDVLRPGDAWGDSDGGPHFGEPFDMEGRTGIGHANIQVSHAVIQEAKEVIGSPTGANTGSETRPKNMKVRFNFQQIQLNAQSFPVGSILPWLSNLAPEGTSLPKGWFEYDKLNREGRFLRGGSIEEIGSFEESQIQDHSHQDLGHTHTDAGHTHIDAGHLPKIYNILIPGPVYGDQDGGPGFAEEGKIDISKAFIKESKAILASSKANLELSKANIGKVLDANTGLEVIPKNIGVNYIVKIF